MPFSKTDLTDTAPLPIRRQAARLRRHADLRRELGRAADREGHRLRTLVDAAARGEAASARCEAARERA